MYRGRMEETYACGIKLNRPTEDLYEILGVEVAKGKSPSTKQYLHEILIRLGKPDLTDDERYAVKALTDIHYRVLYNKTRDNEALHRAGFFDDKIERSLYDLKSLDFVDQVISARKLVENLDKQIPKPKAILFTTGGFAPIHNGHIEMMEEAKRKVEAQGYQVISGYITPGHDSYVGQKYGGTANIGAADRIAMVELAVEDSDWLEVDPFAARYLPAEVNFTFVEYYFQCFIHKISVGHVEIFYVHGSDNTGFGDALPHSVEIARTGLSSKMAREGQTGHLHPDVLVYMNSIGKQATDDLPYLIRSEWSESIAHLNIPDVNKRLSKFQSLLKTGIGQLLANHGSPRKVHIMDVRNQRVEATKVIGDRKTISLDPYFKADVMIHTTRYFSQGGSQKSPICRGPRLEAIGDEETFYSGIESITPGSYVLVEDDSVSGDTIRTVKSLLPTGVDIEEVVLLSDFGDYQGTEYFDVVDLRDFILGSHYGGLTTIHNGRTVRCTNLTRRIYALPYVNLRSRAKIPAAAEMDLSRIIWQANYNLFCGTNLKISDIYSRSFDGTRLMSRLPPSSLVEDYCAYMVDMLLENV